MRSSISRIKYLYTMSGCMCCTLEYPKSLSQPTVNNARSQSAGWRSMNGAKSGPSSVPLRASSAPGQGGQRGHILAVCGSQKERLNVQSETNNRLDINTSHTTHNHVDQSKTHLGRYISWCLGHYCICACSAKDGESCMDSISTMFRVQSC